MMMLDRLPAGSTRLPSPACAAVATVLELTDDFAVGPIDPHESATPTVATSMTFLLNVFSFMFCLFLAKAL